MTDIHIRQDESEENSQQARVKPAPKPSCVPVPFTYTPSDDGTDQNILVLLHGLGDTHIPFAKLGRQLKLPQTATLALRAPEQIPYLYAESYQWYTAFDPFGEPIPPASANPTPGVALLSSLLSHLTGSCAWPSEHIHLFGFGQGGTVAVEAGLQHRSLGSIVSISGPLISYPTYNKEDRCSTPVLIFHRPSPDPEIALPVGSVAALQKGYSRVTEVKKTGGAGMPRSTDEWEPIMRFWSENLSRRQISGLYEVMSGGVATA